jgi:hypothetical protein
VTRFQQVEARYQELLKQYEAGDLAEETFRTALLELQFEDEEQHWWQIAGDGRWLRFDGENWNEAHPPRPLPPPPPAAVLAPPPRPGSLPEVRLELLNDDIFFQTGRDLSQLPPL